MSIQEFSTGQEQPPGFHITIATSPNPGFQMQDEILMIKAALLYADTLTLYSSNVAMLFRTFELAKHDEDERIELILQQAVVKGYDQTQMRELRDEFRKYKALKKKKWGLTRAEQRFLDDVHNRLITEWDKNEQSWKFKLAKDIGFVELIPAYDAGLLELEPLVNVHDPQELAREFVNRVGDLVVSGKAYPLFDDKTGELIRLATGGKVLEPTEARLDHSKHAALPVDVLQHLPLPQASVEDVVAIRGEIKPYLDRFRAAMIEYSGLIKSAPWDVDFPLEAQRVFYEKVAPEVRGIEDAVKGNSYIKGLFRRAIEDKILLSSSTATASTILGMFVSSVHNFGDLANMLTVQVGPVAASIAGGVVVADAVRLAVREKLAQAEKQRTIEQNRVYLYYHAEKRL